MLIFKKKGLHSELNCDLSIFVANFKCPLKMLIFFANSFGVATHSLRNPAVDEQLFPINSKCALIQYMANKPDEFGIKFWLAVFVKSLYSLNRFPYLGKK